MKVEFFGASDDQVLVRKTMQKTAHEKEFEVKEVQGQEVIVGEETDEVLTDDDGEPVTKEQMFDVDSYMALRPVELNVSDNLFVRFEFETEMDSWNISIRPHAENSEFREHAKVSEVPGDWSISLVPVPEDVKRGDPFGGLCLLLEIPEEDEEEFNVEKA